MFEHILNSVHLTFKVFELCLDDKPVLYSYEYA